MASNRDWLFGKPWEEQLAWLDAEHVAVSTTPLEMPTDGEWNAWVGAPKPQNSQSDAPKSEETDEIGASKREIRDFDDEHAEGRSTDFGRTSASSRQSDGDSREKLEADVRKILHSAYMLAWMHGNENRRGCSFEKLHREFYNLLDRQAAITRAELVDCANCPITERNAKVIAELREQLDETKHANCSDSREKLMDEIAMFAGSRRQLIEKMQAWLDRQAAITRAECDNLEVNNLQLHTLAGEQAAMIDELQASLDSTKRAIAKAGGTWTEHEDGTVAVVFAPDVDKLRAECDKLREELRIEREAVEACEGCGKVDDLQAKLDAIKRAVSDAGGMWMEEGGTVTAAFAPDVDELRAERDEWKTKCKTREVAYKQADAERKRYSEQIDELIAECDQLKEQHGRQAETIGRLQERNGELQERVDDLEDELDETKSARDRWREASDDAHYMWDRAATERDGYRTRLGRAIDLAGEIRRIAQ